FPELIKGQYVFLHREGGRGILIDHVDSLDFKNNKYLQGEACITIGHQHWEKAKMGIAAPPIKTDKGWLLLYHGVSNTDHHYRLGAILMKLDDPTTILGRTKYPILEPEMDYEKYGEISNVVFPCGAVIKDTKLLVYYGAADKVIGVASGDLDKILDTLT
ncbi:MAG: Glycosidase-related protein, partial [Candidatus Shapirobacteria bacterium GW2011_GWE1_38_92]